MVSQHRTGLHPGLIYRLVAALDWVELDGDWVVYQPLTGNLAAIDTVDAALLSLLEHAACAGDGLLRQVALASGTTADSSKLAELVADRIDDLQRIGMVEVAP